MTAAALQGSYELLEMIHLKGGDVNLIDDNVWQCVSAFFDLALVSFYCPHFPSQNPLSFSRRTQVKRKHSQQRLNASHLQIAAELLPYNMTQSTTRKNKALSISAYFLVDKGTATFQLKYF